MNSNIKFIQINLHHAKAATGILCRRFIKENLNVALIQEPWAHKNQVLGISMQAGKLIYDENSVKPRKALLIKGGTKFVPLTQFITMQRFSCGSNGDTHDPKKNRSVHSFGLLSRRCGHGPSTRTDNLR